jgi:N-acetylglucosamine-6-phosphate deacetylase
VNHAAANSTLLRHARIVLPARTIEVGNLLIENGRIARVVESSNDTSSTANSEIDLAGLTLFPGFIDIHIHGAVGVDTMKANADDLVRAGEFLLRNGVTAWMPTLVPGPVEDYRRALSAISELMFAPPANAARVLGVHYEGPFVNSEQCGALHREHFRIYQSASDVDDLPTLKNKDAIHLMTLAPEIAGGVDLIKELTRRDWITSIGHTRAGAEILDEAFAAGTRHMTHFMNAMSPFDHRAPGPVGWGLINDEVTCDMIADGIHLVPAALKLILRAKGSKRLSLISDAIAAAGLGDGDYQIWGEQIGVRDGRTQNAQGKIAGSVSTMLDGVRTMLSLGASESEVAFMSSLNPARLLRIDHDCGSIEEGKRADLLALDSALNAQLSIIGGNVVRTD